MWFRLEVVDRLTGVETSWTLQADSYREAREKAKTSGYLILQAKSMETPPKSRGQAPPSVSVIPKPIAGGGIHHSISPVKLAADPTRFNESKQLKGLVIGLGILLALSGIVVFGMRAAGNNPANLKASKPKPVVVPAPTSFNVAIKPVIVETNSGSSATVVADDPARRAQWVEQLKRVSAAESKGVKQVIDAWVEIQFIRTIEPNKGVVAVDEFGWRQYGKQENGQANILMTMWVYCREKGAKTVALYDYKNRQLMGGAREDGTPVIYR